MRLVLGLLKGLIIGGLVGLGAYQLGWGGGFHYVTYGAVGFLVGLLAGRPIWSHLLDKNSTVVVSVLKGIVGFGIGVGLYALVAKAWGGFDITFQGVEKNLHDWQPLMGALIGGVYGGWVEVDDAPPARSAGDKGAGGKGEGAKGVPADAG